MGRNKARSVNSPVILPAESSVEPGRLTCRLNCPRVLSSSLISKRRDRCAVDCGSVVNPDTIEAQIQGAIIFGITAALHGEITLKNGRVEQTNFDTYQMLRTGEAPVIEVYVVPSSEGPGGMGEPGTSAIVPAIANAIFAATGKRLRKMPVDPATLKEPA
jgi:isoquinoline 1-oxidoreductase beta subunit